MRIVVHYAHGNIRSGLRLMYLRKHDDCLITRFDLFRNYKNVVASVSTRKQGFSAGPFASMNMGFTVGDDSTAVERNRKKYCGCEGVGTDKQALLKQVHGTTVYYADKPGFYGEGDGFVTDKAGLFMTVHVADCIPVFLYEPGREIFALLHAGWRGVESGIISRTVQMMSERFAVHPRNIIAALGPHIRDCCYTVGNDVARSFPEKALKKTDEGACHLNLAYCALNQITDAGVPVSSVEHEGFCTSCEMELYYSHRRDGGRTGRMMALFGRL